jgi:hypothetical protein
VVYCFEYSVQAAVISLALLRDISGQQAVKNYQRDITPFCVICGKGIDHDQPAYQLNEGTTQVVTPTFLPVSSIGLLHLSCLGEILEQVYLTLLPAVSPLEVPAKPRLPRPILSAPVQVPVKATAK